jgi:glycosyltransferase involved in cell wall biosynthesis/peptidoglycan/xylan/chitin deacetylase (PgdA/CDA1 family)
MGTEAARRAFTVLTYHRIGDPRSAPSGIVSCTPPQFDRQMRWLASTGRAVVLGELLAARAEGRPTAPGAVHVTFDDAYGDFRDVAWPILQRHGVPVTLFVPTAFPDTERRFWWDRLFGALRGAPARMLDSPVGPLSLTSDEERVTAYRRLREHVKALPHDDAMALVDRLVTELGDNRDSPAVLGWAALRELAAEGVTLAAHSRTHPLLNRLAPERLHDEIAGSMSDLQEHTGAGAPAFAYPGGGVSAQAERVVAEAGATVAFTTEVGANDSATASWLRLRRINVGRRTGPLPVLRARMAFAAATASRPVQRPAHAAGAASAQRVAYISSRFPKLSETFVLAEVLAVARRGVQVDVHPLQTKREQVMHPEAAPLAAAAHYAPLVSVPVARSQVFWLRRDAQGYLSTLAAALRGTWGSPKFFAGALAFFPRAAHAARQMEADGVQHVHCHFASHPALAGFVIHRLTGIPYSFTAHGSDLHVDRTMLPQKVAEAAFVATISEDNRRLILAECGERFADRVHVIRAGVDTSLFTPHLNGRPTHGLRPRVPATDAPLRLLCVGTLHEVKGQGHLVEACRLLAAEGVDVRLRLIGDGPDRPALEQAIAAAGLEDRVVLAGPRTREEVAADLAASDVLVAPSVPTKQGRREGIPVVLMEAMSSGLPVVASGISGIPELVDDGWNGLLVPPGDPAALAQALRRLAASASLRARLGAEGRRTVERGFDVERSADELVRRFAESANGRAGR